MKKPHLRERADYITRHLLCVSRLGKARGPLTWDRLRDWVDQLTSGDLDCTRLALQVMAFTYIAAYPGISARELMESLGTQTESTISRSIAPLCVSLRCLSSLCLSPPVAFF